MRQYSVSRASAKLSNGPPKTKCEDVLGTSISHWEGCVVEASVRSVECGEALRVFIQGNLMKTLVGIEHGIEALAWRKGLDLFQR